MRDRPSHDPLTPERSGKSTTSASRRVESENQTKPRRLRTKPGKSEEIPPATSIGSPLPFIEDGNSFRGRTQCVAREPESLRRTDTTFSPSLTPVSSCNSECSISARYQHPASRTDLRHGGRNNDSGRVGNPCLSRRRSSSLRLPPPRGTARPFPDRYLLLPVWYRLVGRMPFGLLAVTQAPA